MTLFRRSKFTSLERILLERLRDALPQAASEILLEQVANIDHIRRLADNREVLCYRNKYRPAREFPAKQAELKFATITFHTGDLVGRADFYLVCGTFFSIVITPRPTQIRGEVYIDSVKIFDPMAGFGAEKARISREIPRSSVTLPAWIVRLEAKKHVEAKDLREPLDRETRDEFLRNIDSTLPEDYLALIGITEGLVVNGFSILGVSQIYEIVLPDWNYYLVGELHGSGALGTKAHGRQPALYFLDYGGGRSRNLGDTLAGALEVLRPLSSGEALE